MNAGLITPFKPREMQPLYSTTYDLKAYCAFHQNHGYLTNKCHSRRDNVWDLIDYGKIQIDGMANILHKPLSPHGKGTSKNVNVVDSTRVEIGPLSLIAHLENEATLCENPALSKNCEEPNVHIRE